VSLPDNNRTWFSTGAQIKVAKDSVLDLGAAYLNVPESTSTTTRPPRAWPGDRRLRRPRVDLGAQYSMAF
jgi:long-chain fatty acid transport protein